MLQIMSKWATMSSTGVISKGIYVDEDGEEYFVKGNTEPNNKEPYSEVLTSIILTNLQVPNITYYLESVKNFKEIKVFGGCEHVCVCKKHEKDLFQFYNGLCTLLRRRNINDVLKEYISNDFPSEYLIKQLVIDAFIGNQDRHWNNIHFHLDRTPAPILDCGASLLYNTSENDLKIYDGSKLGPDKSKPLKDTHREQIHFLERKFGIPKLFTLTSKEDFLDKVFKDSEEIFQHLSEKRVNAIKSYLNQRYDVYIHPYTIYKDFVKSNSLRW